MKIAVLGIGNMGLWLTQRLKDKHKLAVYDSNREKTKDLSGVLVLEKASALRDFNPALLINAVCIQNTRTAFETVLPFLKQDCILSDIMSVKGTIQDFYSSRGFRFVSIHPMFGPTFSEIDDLRGENVVIIRESCFEGSLFFRNLFKDWGLQCFEYSFDEHDRLIAYSLTLPFASSLVFAANMNSSAVPGTTFKKHREIAKGLLSESDSLLTEILFNPNSLDQLDKVTNKLEFLKHVIRQRDGEEAKEFLDNLRKNI